LDLVAFRGDDILIIPQAIWNIKKGERVVGPKAFYRFNAKSSRFSGSGEQAVQASKISDGIVEVEVLDTHNGMTMCKAQFPLAESDFQLLAVSHSGQRIMLSIGDGTLKLRFECFILESQITIDLDILDYTPHLSIESCQFTMDEEAIACLTSYGHRIILWKLAKGNHGQYISHATASCLLESHSNRITFCLVPTNSHQGQPETEIIIVDDSGTITRKALDEPQTEQDSNQEIPLPQDLMKMYKCKVSLSSQVLTINMYGISASESSMYVHAFIWASSLNLGIDSKRSKHDFLP